jgi:hypothetical protein
MYATPPAKELDNMKPAKAQTINPHETFCLANADHFTAARGRVAGQRTVEKFPSLEAAKAYAAEFGDGRTMIYAITASGNSAHITNA